MASTSRRHALDRFLPVGGGVADVFLVRPDDGRETLLEHVDDRRGVFDRQRGLRDDKPDCSRRAARRRSTSASVCDQSDRARRQLPHGADHLGVAGMADQHDLAAAAVMDLRLAVHLGHQRTGGVEGEQVAPHRFGRASRAARRGRKKSPAPRHRGSRRVPRRKSRPWRADYRPHSGYGRSRAAHRPAGRTARAPAPPIRWPAPPRRKSRAASTAALSARFLRHRLFQCGAFQRGTGHDFLDHREFRNSSPRHGARPPRPVKPGRLHRFGSTPIFRPLSDHPR